MSAREQHIQITCVKLDTSNAFNNINNTTLTKILINNLITLVPLNKLLINNSIILTLY